MQKNPAPNTVPKMVDCWLPVARVFDNRWHWAMFIFFHLGWSICLIAAPLLLGTGLVLGAWFCATWLSTGQQLSHYLYSCTHSKPLRWASILLWSVLSVIFLVWKIKTTNIVAKQLHPLDSSFVWSVYWRVQFGQNLLGVLIGFGMHA